MNEQGFGVFVCELSLFKMFLFVSDGDNDSGKFHSSTHRSQRYGTNQTNTRVSFAALTLLRWFGAQLPSWTLCPSGFCSPLPTAPAPAAAPSNSQRSSSRPFSSKCRNIKEIHMFSSPGSSNGCQRVQPPATTSAALHLESLFQRGLYTRFCTRLFDRGQLSISWDV